MSDVGVSRRSHQKFVPVFCMNFHETRNVDLSNLMLDNGLNYASLIHHWENYFLFLYWVFNLHNTDMKTNIFFRCSGGSPRAATCSSHFGSFPQRNPVNNVPQMKSISTQNRRLNN